MSVMSVSVGNQNKSETISKIIEGEVQECECLEWLVLPKQTREKIIIPPPGMRVCRARMAPVRGQPGGGKLSFSRRSTEIL
jgi:hypothetical protein